MYGKDHKREIDIYRVPASVQIVIPVIVSLLIVAVITLYVIRKKCNVTGCDAGSCVMDCLILFIGGGNLRMEHRFERWFFGILLVGAFFTVAVFGGDLVDSVVRVLNSRIETFEEVVKFNPSVYLDADLAAHLEDILEMLK